MEQNWALRSGQIKSDFNLKKKYFVPAADTKARSLKASVVEADMYSDY